MSINYNRSSNNIKEERKGGREEVEERKRNRDGGGKGKEGKEKEKEAGRKINAIIRIK